MDYRKGLFGKVSSMQIELMGLVNPNRPNSPRVCLVLPLLVLSRRYVSLACSRRMEGPKRDGAARPRGAKAAHTPVPRLSAEKTDKHKKAMRSPHNLPTPHNGGSNKKRRAARASHESSTKSAQSTSPELSESMPPVSRQLCLSPRKGRGKGKRSSFESASVEQQSPRALGHPHSILFERPSFDSQPVSLFERSSFNGHFGSAAACRHSAFSNSLTSSFSGTTSQEVTARDGYSFKASTDRAASPTGDPGVEQPSAQPSALLTPALTILAPHLPLVPVLGAPSTRALESPSEPEVSPPPYVAALNGGAASMSDPIEAALQPMHTRAKTPPRTHTKAAPPLLPQQLLALADPPSKPRVKVPTLLLQNIGTSPVGRRPLKSPYPGKKGSQRAAKVTAKEKMLAKAAAALAIAAPAAAALAAASTDPADPADLATAASILATSSVGLSVPAPSLPKFTHLNVRALLASPAATQTSWDTWLMLQRLREWDESERSRDSQRSSIQSSSSSAKVSAQDSARR